MTDKGVWLKVIDNTGAKYAQLFTILGKRTLTIAVGDIVRVSVVEAIPNCQKAPKGSVHLGIITTIAGKFSGNMQFSHSTVVLLGGKSDKKNVPGMLGTRLHGPVSRCLLDRGNVARSIVSKAEEVF